MVNRRRELEALFQQYPGRAPGGSGPTGIGHARMLGNLVGPPSRQTLAEYGGMLGEQQEYLDLIGEAPEQVRFGRQLMNPALTPLFDQEGQAQFGAGQTNPAMARPRARQPWSLGGPQLLPESHESFMRRQGRG